jgi:CRISPR/Cas system-associated protein endoribonuclease Cas2
MYEQEVTFDNCRYINKLKFDFKIFIEDKSFLLEYNGKQHYMIVNFSNDYELSKEKFKLNKKRDKIKKQFCSDNNIPLYIISYKQYRNLKNTLNLIIENFKVSTTY